MPTALGTIASQYKTSAGSWTPAQLPGLAAWYDASDAASFTYSSGSVVSQWNDKSGRGKHAVQATVGNQPTRNGVQNGRACVTFNGTTTYLSAAGVFSTASLNTHTMIVIANNANSAGGLKSPICAGQVRMFRDGSNIVACYGGSSIVSSPVVWGDRVRLVVFRLTGASSTGISVDGGAWATGNAGLNGSTDLEIGRSPGENWGGTICEVITMSSVITDTDLALLNTYAQQKWFDPIPLSIPWHAAYWASDPAWTPPANGGVMSSWHDGSGNGWVMTQGTAAKQPIYRASSSLLNNKPAVQFDGVDDEMGSASFTSTSPPFTMVAVHCLERATGNSYFVSANPNSNLGIDNGGLWLMYAGSALTATGNDLSRHLHVAYFSGATSSLKIDGVQKMAGNPGSVAAVHWRIGSYANGGTNGQGSTAFVGFKFGALTAQEEADLLAWSRSFYGTP